ncbi:unnamed protein product, partial [Sphacelaria rigidula]
VTCLWSLSHLDHGLLVRTKYPDLIHLHTTPVFDLIYLDSPYNIGTYAVVLPRLLLISFGGGGGGRENGRCLMILRARDSRFASLSYCIRQGNKNKTKQRPCAKNRPPYWSAQRVLCFMGSRHVIATFYTCIFRLLVTELKAAVVTCVQPFFTPRDVRATFSDGIPRWRVKKRHSDL